MSARRLRVAIGSLFQETNTFVPFVTTLETFQSQYVWRGEELLEGFKSGRVEVPGFISVLREAGVEIVPTLSAYAASGGPLTRAAFDTLLGELVERIAQAGPLDGVLLALHGAMTVEDEPDAEGEIIERVRAVLPPGLPLGISLDLHGHITPRMLQPDTFLIGYREYPHIDMFETGQRVARLMLDRLAGRVHPVMALAKVPMIVSPVAARTGDAPLNEVIAAARQMEADGRILHASLFAVQPWLDVPDIGFAALVCADGDVAAAQAAANELADMAWQARTRFEPDLTPLEDAIRIGLASDGTTVVADGGDAPSSGAAADNATVLKTLLQMGAERAGRLTYLTLCDAEAAAAAARAGVGSTVTLAVGHKMTPGEGAPLTVTGQVRTLTDGRYIMYDAGANGMEARIGPTAVLAIGDIRLALRSLPSLEWDTGLYLSVGLDPRRAALVFVKSPSHFRTAYAPLAARILVANTPGPACSDMRQLRFSRVTRPLYPLDAM
jgi:microcystin degradation protein MlrC